MLRRPRSYLVALGLAGLLGTLACRGGEHAEPKARRDSSKSASKPGAAGPESAQVFNETMHREGKICDLQERPDREPCRQACRRGHSNSCARLGTYLARGLAGDKNEQRAIELFREACRGGSGLGCASLARRSQGEEKARLLRRARFYARVHCQQDHRLSCFALAGMFEGARGGPADPGAARFYRRRACELGLEKACAAPGGP